MVAAVPAVHRAAILLVTLIVPILLRSSISGVAHAAPLIRGGVRGGARTFPAAAAAAVSHRHTLQGVGYCSHDVAAPCTQTSDCSCQPISEVEAATKGNVADDKDIFVRGRGRRGLLQCSGASQRNECLSVGNSCDWVRGNCVSTTSAPTDRPATDQPSPSPTNESTSAPSKAPTDTPTPSPSKSPNNTPTGASIQCACLWLPPSHPPTNSPTIEPSSTIPPTKRPVTIRPTSSPFTYLPTGSPVTNSPAKTSVTASPTTSPMTQQPTVGPITNSPTQTPVTSSPALSPVTGSPAGSLVTNSPTHSPVTGMQSLETPSATSNPMTQPPTESPFTNLSTQNPVTDSIVTNSLTQSLETPSLNLRSCYRTVAFAVNAGGTEYDDVVSGGYNYSPDTEFVLNGKKSGNENAGVIVDAPLYHSERYADPDLGELNYEFPVEVGKEYKVTLMFAEIWPKIESKGPRVFDVLIEDPLKTFLDVDIFKLVGFATPYQLEYTYLAADDTLDIDLVSKDQNAKISAIVIEELQCTQSDPTTSPTHSPSRAPSSSPDTSSPTKVTAPITGSPTSSPVTQLPTGSFGDSLPTQSPVTGNPVSNSPTHSLVTTSPTEPLVATYMPGDFTANITCDDGKLRLSGGLACRLLTTGGQPVKYANGSQSTDLMHGRADGAGVVKHPVDGWYYVSNSEVKDGGVGALRFNGGGELIGYERLLSNTADNCGGGLTFWDTWISCEENGSLGYCHEVDPFTGNTTQVLTVPRGGDYESFAFDNKDPDVPARFFTTEDDPDGALIRYTPPDAAYGTGSKYDILTTPGGTHDYLILDPNTGTFSWSTNFEEAETNASLHYPKTEGIDVHNRILNFVSKARKKLYTLDLAAGTYTTSSTRSGSGPGTFDLQPDQLARIIGEHDILYFCEDGGSDCDIHGRDATGQYFTIVRGDGHETENSGLAFSPDNRHMYFSMQGTSNIYDVWREDGLPFNGAVAATKYHSDV